MQVIVTPLPECPHEFAIVVLPIFINRAPSAAETSTHAVAKVASHLSGVLQMLKVASRALWILSTVDGNVSFWDR